MQTGSIGAIVFSTSSNRVFTWREASFDVSARYARHEVFGNKQVLEFTGPDVKSVNLSIHLNKNVGVDPDTEIAKLEEIVLSGEEQLCVLGGTVLGWMVIESMSTPVKHTDGRGKTLVADISLNLTEFVRVVSNSITNSSGTSLGNLSAQAGQLQADIMDSGLSGTFLSASAAVESAMAGALDAASGVTAAVQGAVSGAAGYLESAVTTANTLASTVMTPANIALATMQGVVDAANTIAPLGLESVSERLGALKDVTAIGEKAQALVSGKADDVRALLERASMTSDATSLRGLVTETGGAAGA